MTIPEFYQVVGGNYEDVVARFMKDALVLRFLRMFPDDTSMDVLTSTLKAKDVQAAFRAAHTLKGVALNLGLGQLAGSAATLTEALRGADALPANVQALYENVYKEYVHVIDLLDGLEA